MVKYDLEDPSEKKMVIATSVHRSVLDGRTDQTARTNANMDPGPHTGRKKPLDTEEGREAMKSLFCLYFDSA